MTGTEFLKAMKDGTLFSPKLCGCGCKKPLEPRVDGRRQTMGSVEVNDDCYYAAMSDVVEQHPIRRIGRRV